MFTRILAAIDFSALAAAFDARLHLLHVLPNGFLRAVVSDPRDLESAVVNQVLDRAHAGDNSELRPVAAVERSDDPGDEIVRYTRTQAIDLIVMGTHGRRRVAHALMSSVAERVIRSARCPVITVPKTSAGARKIFRTAAKNVPAASGR